MPPNSATEERRGKSTTVIKRFGIHHQTIFCAHPNNLTTPVDDVPKNSPVGSEAAIAALKSIIIGANGLYETA